MAELVARVRELFAEPPASEAEARHREVIRAQIEKLEGKVMRVYGRRDFRPEDERDSDPGGT